MRWKVLAICPRCGLPEELCVCDVLEKEATDSIHVYKTRKRFRKLVTIIEGIDKDKLHETAKELKHMLACGGSAKDGVIVLQGDQTKKVKKALVKLGYPENAITVDESLHR